MKNWQPITCGIFYCRDSAEINGCGSLQTLSWLDSDVLRSRQQNIPLSGMSFMRHLIIIITFLFTSSAFSYGQVDSFKNHKIDTLQIQTKFSNDTLFLKPVETKVQNDSGFDWKVWLPTFTALIILLVTNLVTLYKIRKDTKEAIKKEIIISKVKIERERLEKFYDPIFTTLKSNSSIFNSYGPQTFPKDGGVLETEASEVWKQLVQNVIIPNNKKIRDTIQQFSHLISPNDNIAKYLDYSVHAESFEHFIKFPNTLHKSFKYPTDFISNVEASRNAVLNNLQATENKLLI